MTVIERTAMIASAERIALIDRATCNAYRAARDEVFAAADAAYEAFSAGRPYRDATAEAEAYATYEFLRDDAYMRAGVAASDAAEAVREAMTTAAIAA